MKDKRKHRRRLRPLFGAIDLPPDTLVRTSAVNLTSDCEALVVGCRRIREYRGDRVVLTLCDGELTIEGEGLTMRTYFGSQIRICGRITGVTYG